MFPPPSHYLLLGYLALSSVAVPVHLAPGIPAGPSQNLLSLNEKAGSCEWIPTWRDGKFIQKAAIQLSVSAERRRQDVYESEVFWKRGFEGDISPAVHKHT